MFDLFRSQAKATRILLGVLLGMVALSMLVYLIPGAGTPTGDRTDQTVAEIGKNNLSLREVELEVQGRVRNQQLPPDVAQVFIPQLIDQMIAERAAAYQAQELGYEVSDKDLANTIRSFGQFATLTPDQYKAQLEQMGLTVPEFENNVRQDMYKNVLKNLSLEGVIVTPSEVESEYRRRNEKIKLDYIAFDPTKLAAEIKPTTQELQTYFDANKNFFSLPETRNVQLIVVDQAKVAESIQVSDTQVLSFYNTHKDQYRTAERVKARHILLSTQGKPKEEVDKIKAKAEDLLKQAKAGGDFAKLAEKNSEDPGSAAKGGDLGWVVRGQMVKEFEETTFSLKPKEISNVITTMYGFHIIQVMEKEPARLRTVEEVKPEILTSLRNQSVFDRMQATADQARGELAKAPQNAALIAGKMNLIYAPVEKFKSGDQIPALGTDNQISGSIMSLKKGEVSQVLQSGNKLVIAEVTDIIPPHVGTLADVEAQVRSRVTQDRGTALAAERSKKAADLLKSNGGDLKAAAKAVGAEVKTTAPFERNGTVEGIGSAGYLGDSFEKPVGTQIGPLNANSVQIVGKISERIPADMTKLAEAREGIMSSVKQKKAQMRELLFQDSVLNYLVSQGKVKVHRDVINKLVARYRS